VANTGAPLQTDLALTAAGVEGAGEMVVADSWHWLDLAVGPRRTGGRARDGGGDLQATDGRANLAQALIVRLLTPIGDLAHLGHPAYGSRLGELVGQLNDERTRNLARRHVIEAIRAEARVGRLDQLVVRVPDDRPDVVEITFSVVPVSGDDPLAIALEVVL
jgi:phage baseplate assembly protein W